MTTYHGFAFSIVQEFGGYLGLDQQTRVITPGFGRQLLLETLSEGRYEYLDLSHVRGRIEELVGLGSELSNHLYRPQDLSNPADALNDIELRRSELAEVLARYDLKKRALSAVDFGDMIAVAHHIVATIPRVRTELRRRFQLVLLDEYQDTNAAQRKLLTSLFSEGHPVTAVGDTGQTIYEWRGATARNFDAFPTDFPDPDGNPSATLQLTTNYRSGTSVLDLANQIRKRTGEQQVRDLVAAPSNPDAEVATAWFHSAVDEANWIAQEITRVHEEEGIERSGGGAMRWSDIAVLFRKNAHIDLVRQALEAEGIPVEVASIGALVHVPEVAQLHAWLQLLERGDLDGAVLRILLGPRFRLGIGDIAKLVGWNEGSTTTQVLEAIEAAANNAASGPDLDVEIARRVSQFWDEYRTLLIVAQGLTLGDLCRRILDTTSAWIEIESMHDAARLSARLNVYRFLDLAEAWSPLEGRPSLAAFLDYLDSLLDETAADEMEAAHVGSEDAVALLTVHRAKGLEWEVVVLPALAYGIFPSQGKGANPEKSPAALPLSMRPDHDATMDADTFVRFRHEVQEWRTAYVAVTRAKQRLVATGAYFYSFVKPKRPGELFEIIRNSPTTVERRVPGPTPKDGEGPDSLTITIDASPDPDFSEGWREELTSRLESNIPMQPNEALAEQQAVLFDIPVPLPASVGDEELTVSVTGLVTYATCPLRYYWSEVDRLPRRPNRRALAGTKLHRRIELHNLGKVPLSEELTYDNLDTSHVGRYSSFLESRLGSRTPILVEAPFLYRTDLGRVRGRIDAVYGDEDHWEIVDFKSGRKRTPGPEILQLQAYALAASENGLGRSAPDLMDVTFAYLGEGFETHTETADDRWISEARSDVASILHDIAEKRFEATPSDACRSCDFVGVCEIGKEFLASADN
ncbi:MAG: ATP-dependent helicase [Acidimicrobiia bacterium]|nr:ATP-dependent helicase [Acidimicrobiia bacterium]